jgi:uncharacterized protein DUF1016
MRAKRSMAKARSAPLDRLLIGAVLVDEVRGLILEARQQTTLVANAGLTLLYWRVGDRIRREILKESRAEYGAKIVRSLSAQLEMEFGHGFGEKNLRRMVQFAELFSDPQIVATLSRRSGWPKVRTLLPDRCRGFKRQAGADCRISDPTLFLKPPQGPRYGPRF